MGKGAGRRRSKRKKSSESDLNDSVTKAGRYANSQQTAPDASTVSDILNQTHQVLFSEEGNSVFAGTLGATESTDLVPNHYTETACEPLSSPAPTSSSSMATSASADPSRGPSNADIMSCLHDIQSKIGNIDQKMESMENRLKSLENLEKKVDDFDREMKKLWVHVHDSNTKTSERLEKVADKLDTTDFSLGLVNDKVLQLEKEKDTLKDEVVYLKSQSMRNNLVFVNIPEASSRTNADGETMETGEASAAVPENCEEVVKTFIHEKMKVAKELVDNMCFDRVHRIGQPKATICRKIVARFRDFKDREFVRKQWKSLEGTQYNVHEQFPPEVVEKRKKLVPRAKAARKQGKTSWIAYDTLYIDGKPVRD